MIHSQLGPLAAAAARNLGVIFDSNLSFNKQVSTVVQSCYFQLRNISKIKSFLSPPDLEKVIHALITSRLDYCNSLYSGLCKKTISRLQLIQNSAARLLTNTRKQEHITPILAALHWLPVSHRCDFKILLITYKALHGLAPSYVSDMIPLRETGRILRSTNKALLEGRNTNLVTRGDRAFAARAPRLWNALPLHLRLAPSLSLFKSLLKTHLYTNCYS